MQRRDESGADLSTTRHKTDHQSSSQVVGVT